jgi:hypothetical protein
LTYIPQQAVDNNLAATAETFIAFLFLFCPHKNFWHKLRPVCHSRVFNICSSLAAFTRMFLSAGNTSLLKNYFYSSLSFSLSFLCF